MQPLHSSQPPPIRRSAVLVIGLLSFGSIAVAVQVTAPLGAAVVLTFDPAANIVFQGAADSVLVALQGNLAKKLCSQITQRERAQQPMGRCFAGATEEPAVVQLYLTRNGQIHRYFSTHAGAFDRPISMGSISKTLGVVALAEIGASPDEMWCAKKFFKVKNADGFVGYNNCTSRSAQPAAESIAKSDTLATLNRLRQVDEKWLRGRLLEAGVFNTPLDHHPGIAAATGVLEMTPRQVLEQFHAIASGHARRTTFVRGSPLPASKLAIWTQAVMAVPIQANYVQTLMAAPATHPLGTAHHLPALLPPLTGIYSKTGTSQGATQNVTGKYLAFSVFANGVIWSGLATVQTPRQEQTLGKGLQGSDFALLHALLANEIAADTPSVNVTITPKQQD